MLISLSMSLRVKDPEPRMMGLGSPISASGSPTIFSSSTLLFVLLSIVNCRQKEDGEVKYEVGENAVDVRKNDRLGGCALPTDENC
mmetsp:Transcript_16794/g.22987  ORF Transcript_16794/g.22987 Transcript_16794/m.22987 type:complete len:86 (+) Transcript_16794:774-1031(+)